MVLLTFLYVSYPFVQAVGCLIQPAMGLLHYGPGRYFLPGCFLPVYFLPVFLMPRLFLRTIMEVQKIFDVSLRPLYW